MFRKASARAPAAGVPSAPSGASHTEDIVVRTMPREFYGKEAVTLETVKEAAPPVVPVAAPRVVPQSLPTVPPAQLPQTLPPLRRRSRTGIVVTIVVALLMIGGIAYGSYVFVQSANRSAQLAEEKAQQAAAQLAAEKAAAESAARKAAEDAAKAAATPVPAKDTDSDGLTDVEELLYGTNFRDPDSDKDTFLDGNEVFHRYHPLGVAPATLLDTGAVKIFSDATYPYTIYYPATWTVALARESFGVTFQSARQASITVAWQEKGADQTIDDVLRTTAPSVDRSQMKDLLTKAGYFGFTSGDDRTAYLDLGTAMATLTYDLGGKPQIEYLQTFKMMVNSLVLLQGTP